VEKLLGLGTLLGLDFRAFGRSWLHLSGPGLSSKPLLPHVIILPAVSVRLVLKGTLTSGDVSADRSALSGWRLCCHTTPSWLKIARALVAEHRSKATYRQ
jgi:hypothetical protein